MWLKIILFSLSLVVYTEATVIFSPCSPASPPPNATCSPNIYVCDGCGMGGGSCGQTNCWGGQNDGNAGSCGCEKKMDLSVQTGSNMCHGESGCSSVWNCGHSSNSDCGCGRDCGCDSSAMNKDSMACPCQSPSCVGDSSEMNKASMACPCQSSFCEPFPNDSLIKQMHCLVDKMAQFRLPTKGPGVNPQLAEYCPGCMALKEFGALFDHLKAFAAFGDDPTTTDHSQNGHTMGRETIKEADHILETLIASYKGTASILDELDEINHHLQKMKHLKPMLADLESEIMSDGKHK